MATLLHKKTLFDLAIPTPERRPRQGITPDTYAACESRHRAYAGNVEDRLRGDAPYAYSLPPPLPSSRCDCLHLAGHHRKDHSCMWPGCHAARPVWAGMIDGERIMPTAAGIGDARRKPR